MTALALYAVTATAIGIAAIASAVHDALRRRALHQLIHTARRERDAHRARAERAEQANRDHQDTTIRHRQAARRVADLELQVAHLARALRIRPPADPVVAALDAAGRPLTTAEVATRLDRAHADIEGALHAHPWCHPATGGRWALCVPHEQVDITATTRMPVTVLGRPPAVFDEVDPADLKVVA